MGRVTQGKEGLLRIRLVGPWKLVAGGSFALDTQPLERSADGNNKTQVSGVPASPEGKLKINK